MIKQNVLGDISLGEEEPEGGAGGSLFPKRFSTAIQGGKWKEVGSLCLPSQDLNSPGGWPGLTPGSEGRRRRGDG